MFKADIEIRGKHALYIKKLVEDEKIFTRNLDVYMAAPIIGYVYGKKEQIDKNEEYNEVTRKIGTQALVGEEKNLDLIFRLIMLLDKTDNPNLEYQVDRAFRHDSNQKLKDEHEKNMELFNSYVRGGITILYEKIISNDTIKDDYYQNIFEFVKDYSNEIDGLTEEQAEEALKGIM